MEKIKEERRKKRDEKIEIRKRKKDEDGKGDRREKKIQLESWMMILLNSLHKEEARRRNIMSSSFIIPSFSSFPSLLSLFVYSFPTWWEKV